MNLPVYRTVVAGVLLVLFGALEVDAIMKEGSIEQALSGLGIAGSLLLLWWQR